MKVILAQYTEEKSILLKKLSPRANEFQRLFELKNEDQNNIKMGLRS
jgi:hypothetical protein